MDAVKNPELLNMDRVKIDPTIALRVPGKLALRRMLLPFARQDDHVLVACLDPQDDQGMQAVERYVESAVIPCPAEKESLEAAIHRVYIASLDGLDTSGDTAPTGDEAGDRHDIVALSNELLHAARIRQATDIHIIPRNDDTVVLLRVDGVLEKYRELPQSVHTGLVSRFKVLAGMDIAERRAPQDGRFTIGTVADTMVDVRAATLPTKQGERLTLRLLATQTEELTLERLGMMPAHLEVFSTHITRPNGLILLTGPTGCGKSTTLYAAIRKLMADRSLNIITIEDPVEYVIPGVSQVEVDSADKVSFQKALRSSLRHDPDVLMIGEIRDEETAEIAVKAALTGHLVFSTLHTNSAAGSITRLIDMGIQPYLVGAVSRLLVAQRLVRRLCQQCRRPAELDETQALILHRPGAVGMSVYEPVGCHYCAGTGFVGRTGLFEMIPVDRDLARLASTGAGQLEIVEYLMENNIPFLIDDAIRKLSDGQTSFSELTQVINLF